MGKSASYFVKIFDTSFTSPKFLGSALLLGVEVSQVVGLWAMFKSSMKMHYPNGEIQRADMEALLPVWCQTSLDPKVIIDTWIKYKLLIPDMDLLKVNDWDLYEGADLRKAVKRSERNKKYYNKKKDKTSESDIKTSEIELNDDSRRLMSQTEEEEEEYIEVEEDSDIDYEVLVQDEINNEEFFDRDKRSAINYKIAECCGWDNPTESQWGRIHKAGKELDEAGYGPTDIAIISENLLKTYGAKALTPQGIANNVQLLHGARTMKPEEFENLQDQKELDEWGKNV